jgi:hypothetical protein
MSFARREFMLAADCPVETCVCRQSYKRCSFSAADFYEKTQSEFVRA